MLGLHNFPVEAVIDGWPPITSYGYALEETGGRRVCGYFLRQQKALFVICRDTAESGMYDKDDHWNVWMVFSLIIVIKYSVSASDSMFVQV